MVLMPPRILLEVSGAMSSNEGADKNFKLTDNFPEFESGTLLCHAIRQKNPHYRRLHVGVWTMLAK